MTPSVGENLALCSRSIAPLAAAGCDAGCEAYDLLAPYVMSRGNGLAIETFVLRL